MKNSDLIQSYALMLMAAGGASVMFSIAFRIVYVAFYR